MQASLISEAGLVKPTKNQSRLVERNHLQAMLAKVPPRLTHLFRGPYPDSVGAPVDTPHSSAVLLHITNTSTSLYIKTEALAFVRNCVAEAVLYWHQLHK